MLVAIAIVFAWRLTTSQPPASTTPLRTATAMITGFPGGVKSASGPVQAGFTRYSGTITERGTDSPIEGVCVYAGPASGCPSPSLVTDAAGHWAFDFPSSLVWQFNFEHPAYAAVLQVTPEMPTSAVAEVTIKTELAARPR